MCLTPGINLSIFFWNICSPILQARKTTNTIQIMRKCPHFWSNFFIIHIFSFSIPFYMFGCRNQQQYKEVNCTEPSPSARIPCPNIQSILLRVRLKLAREYHIAVSDYMGRSLGYTLHQDYKLECLSMSVAFTLVKYLQARLEPIQTCESL